MRELSVWTLHQIVVKLGGKVGTDCHIGEHAVQLARVLKATNLLSHAHGNNEIMRVRHEESLCTDAIWDYDLPTLSTEYQI